MVARVLSNRGRSVGALALAAALLMGCGSGKDTAANAGAPAPTTTVPCTGSPLRLTTITGLTGPVAFPSVAAELQDAYKAAQQSINAACELGRPLEIVVCDDKSDPNQATKCGRDAAGDGSLALFGNAGLNDTGTTAANLPAVLTNGATNFDLTNERSFPVTSALNLVMGAASAAKAAKTDQLLMVAFDTGPSRTFIALGQAVATQLGVKMDVQWVPPDTTDFAPIAAQISQQKPKAIATILTKTVPFLNALDAEGISPKDMPIMAGVNLFPLEAAEQLGAKADGLYLLSQAAPPSDDANPGIKQMLTELKNAGVDKDPKKLSPATTVAWSQVHILADALKVLPKAEIAALDSAKLVEVIGKLGPVNRAEITPFDFTTRAYAEIPPLAKLRLFSRQDMVLRVKDGAYETVSPFGDATKPFNLES
jgi:branched-chain amino acid transport system substrate-binding protein